MIARIWNVAIVLFWLTSMSLLFWRDILPSWLAGEPPASIDFSDDEALRVERQAGIFHRDSRRVGTNWVRFYPTRDQLQVKSTTLVDGLSFLPPLRVVSRFTFRKDGVLDHFDMIVFGAPVPIKLKGENYDPDFPCELVVGPSTYRWRMDTQTSRMLAETFRPFTRLPGLYVGQSWRMRMIDPLAAVTGRGGRFDVVLVRVTGRETIEHHGESIECFRVEAPDITAYVTADGEVVRQHIDVPVFGSFTILNEPYDDQARQEAERQVPAWVVPEGVDDATSDRRESDESPRSGDPA